MIKILLVDDNAKKVSEIKKIILENENIKEKNIAIKVCSRDARISLYESEFDLFIIDLLIPESYGDSPNAEESIYLLHDINHDDEMNKPLNIIGITAFEEEIEKYEKYFKKESWHLISYNQSIHNWKDILKNKIEYIINSKKNNKNNEGYKYDIGIICALDEPEFKNIKLLSKDWEEITVKKSSVTFYETTFERDGKKLNVIATSINKMGMVSTSILATQMIEEFRPKYLTMTGIAAGIKEEVDLGDIIVFEYSWDYNSGKIKVDEKGNKLFDVDIRQESLDKDLSNYMLKLKNDNKFLFDVYDNYKGKKPKNLSEIQIGHAVSGAAVIANNDIVKDILKQERKLKGIEMEGYAIYSAAYNATKPKPTPIVIKSVCDFADENKNDDIQDYAAYISAKVLYEFALRYF